MLLLLKLKLTLGFHLSLLISAKSITYTLKLQTLLNKSLKGSSDFESINEIFLLNCRR